MVGQAASVMFYFILLGWSQSEKSVKLNGAPLSQVLLTTALKYWNYRLKTVWTESETQPFKGYNSKEDEP